MKITLLRATLTLILLTGLITAGVSALDGYDYYQEIEYSGYDQETYQQDIIIHRTGGTAYEESAGGLNIWHIYVGGHCREDYGDIRFADNGDNLAYYLWPDYDDESARFCVRLENADADGTLAVYYGHPSSTTTSDGDTTFLFFDDFASLNSDKWDATSYVGSGTIAIADGRARIATTTKNNVPALVSKDQIDIFNIIIESSIRLNSMGGQVAGMHIRPDMGSNAYQGYFVASSTASSQDAYLSGPTGSYVFDRHFLTWSTNQWYNFKWTFGDSSVTWDRDGVSTSYATLYSHPAYLYFGAYAPGNSIKTFDMEVDYILVRAYSPTPPALLSASGEQSTPTPPTASFTASPTVGTRPLTVTFTDTSTGSPTSWLWSFGDDSPPSTAQNPQHTYTAAGTYTITLTATNDYGGNTTTRTNYIDVGDPPAASFTATPPWGYAPLTVSFTDTSTGSPTSWLWSFGDNTSPSTAQNPQHTYTTVGTYTVTLTATNKYGSTSTSQTVSARTILPFPGIPALPRDLDGDGLYEDINGNGRLDYNDLTTLFLNFAWARQNQPIDAFDYNQNGRLDYADIIALFQVIS